MCRWAGAPLASSAVAVANLARILAVEVACRAASPRPPGPPHLGRRHRCRARGRPHASGRSWPGSLAGARAGRRGAARCIRRVAHGRHRRDRPPVMSGPRPVRRTEGVEPDVQGLAPRGGHADADEQPRPRGGRAAGRPRRLRRHGTGGPLVGHVRRHGPHASRAGRRRDDAGAVREARRRLPHARVGAAGAPRQLEPRPGVGNVGRVPSPRAARPDDVRPDDGRLVDLHRHPRHPPGNVRVLRGDRPAALYWQPRRHDHAHRRPGWHGWGPATGGDDERWRGAVRRRRWPPDRTASRDSLPRRGGHRPRRRGALVVTRRRRRGER